MSMKGYTIEQLLLDIAHGKGASDLLASFPDPCDKGRLLDGLARCVVALRAAVQFENSVFLVGGSNQRLAPLKNIRDEFLDTRVNNSCGNGTSDVSFCIGDTLYLCSSKYFENTKSIDEYDLAELNNLYHVKYRPFYSNIEMILFVKDKEDFEAKYTRANKRDLYSVSCVFGVCEIEKMLVTMRETFARRNITDGMGIEDLMRNMLDIRRTMLALRPHQKIALYRTFSIEDASRSRRPILWAMLPRSGKSYMTAGHILESIRRGRMSFLIITPVPSETMAQFKEDMFDSLVEFADIDIMMGSDISAYIKDRKKKGDSRVKPFVAMMSKQLDHAAVRVTGSGVAKGFRFDVIYYDENHYGGTTDLSRSMIASYTDSHTQLILMTATYHKPHHSWNIPDNNIVRWDLDGLEAARGGDVTSLRELYGGIADRALEGIPVNELKGIYGREPRMCIMSAFHRHEYVQRFRAIYGEKTSHTGADMDRIFELNSEFKLSNPRAVGALVDIILGSPFAGANTPCVMDNIVDHANIHGGRGMMDGLSQLWFMPYGVGRYINDVSRETKELISRHPVGCQYHVACFSECTINLRDFVSDNEAYATAAGKRGCIFLTGERGSMGISLKKVDIVVMLSHVSSADGLYQKIYRSMTADEGKRYGYVVDLDAQRVLNTLLMYEGACKRLTRNMDMRRRILRLSRIVELRDVMDITMDENSIVSELLDIWREDIGTRLGYIDRKMEELHIEFDDVDARAIRGLISGSYTAPCAKNQTIAINDTSRKLPQSGYREVEIGDVDALAEQMAGATLDDTAVPDPAEPETKPEEEYDISDVLPTVVKLSAILTSNRLGHHDWISMADIVSSIYNDTWLCCVFEDQCAIYWDIRDMGRFKSTVLSVIQKLNDGVLQDIKELVECIRESMTRYSLDDKKGLLEYLQSVLRPKEVEKKKYGEVFTPLTLVEEMLDRLPTHVWEDPSLRWFDPAVGIGNFMVCVYYRLMEGLKGAIQDEEDRKFHIVHYMLYMSEINQKNVHICRLIFGEDANIHHGDTLQLDPLGKWEIDGFDVVVGNPPYNDASACKGKGHTMWVRFIENTIKAWLKMDGYLCTVHPALWRQVDHDMYKLLSQYQILYLEIHNDADGMKVFKCSTRYDWYVLHKKDYYKSTIVLDEKNVVNEIDMREWRFIPNCMYQDVKSLIASNNETTCEIICDRSAYGSDKKWVSKQKSTDHEYPVVYTIRKGGDVTFLWSSRNDRGHYGTPKVIIRSATPIIETISDPSGKYAMTQWTLGIVADEGDHDHISNTLKSSYFQKIIGAISFRNEVSIAAMRLFKARFWEFLDN